MTKNLRKLERFLSGPDRNVRIKGGKGIEGLLGLRFLKEVTVQEVTIATDEGENWLTIKDAKFDWDGCLLCVKRIKLEDVTVQEVCVDQKKLLRSPSQPSDNYHKKEFLDEVWPMTKKFRKLECSLSGPDRNVRIKGLQGLWSLWKEVSVQEVTIATDEGENWLTIKDAKFDFDWQARWAILEELSQPVRWLRRWLARPSYEHIQIKEVTAQEVWVDLKKFKMG